MLKRVFIWICFVLIIPAISFAIPPIPYKIGGTVTVDGTQLTQATDAGYIFRVTRSNGSDYINSSGNPAEDTDGLNTFNYYSINIPIYDASEQPGGANPGEKALIRVYRNGVELPVASPVDGEITIGKSGDIQLVNIIVAQNQPPTAYAGPDQVVDAGDAVTLDGSGSTDPDDGIAAYQWEQIGGPMVALSDASSAKPVFRAPSVGSEGAILTFRLTVADSGGLTDADTCTVTVAWVNQPPTADAGPDQIVDEGDAVTLNGSGSTDPDDGIVAYQWEQIGGPAVALSGASSAKPVFTAPSVGTNGASLTFRLTVVDSGGLTDIDTCTVNVAWVNQPPTADAGPDQAVDAGDAVTLDGSGSTDPDDGIASYQWVQIGGPAVALSNPSSAKPVFTTPSVGPEGAILTFRLTVVDSGGLADTDTCTVSVAWVNQPPTADAGPDQVVNEGDTVSLDGSTSSDPDDGIAAYQWEQIGGPAVALSDASSAKPVFRAPSVGPEGASLTFRLTVADRGGLTDADTCMISVARINQPPTADAGPDQAVDAGDAVTLDGSGSTDPDDGIASYQWEQIGGPAVALSDASSAKPVFTAPFVGTNGASLTFRLTVADSGGLTDTDTSTVNVAWVNQPPKADAGFNQAMVQGDRVTLDGSNSADPDDGIASYQWRQLYGSDVNLSGANSAKASFTAPDVPPEGASFFFELTVTDNGGLTDTDTCRVNVIQYINQPPSADAGPDQTVDQGETVTLDGSNSSDPDDGIASYKWRQTEGPDVVLSDETDPKPEFTAPDDVGVDGVSLVFELTVTDHGGLTDTDTSTVHVTWSNQPPTADAGADQTVNEGETVTLDGINSSDPDDGIASYQWRQTGGPDVFLSDATDAKPQFTAPDGVGVNGASLVFELTVTDHGGLTDTDTCIVNVTWSNQPPTADAGPDQTVDAGETVILYGSNSHDPDDGIASYRWRQTGGPSITFSDATSAQPEFSAPAVGIDGALLLFELTVTDYGGLMDTDICTVAVTWVNQPPTADAGPDQIVDAGETVFLDGSNSHDPDDGIASYRWRQTGGPSITFSDATSAQPEFSAPAVGIDGALLVFELTVTDYGGLMDTDICTVVVTWVNQPPTADAGPDQTVDAGETVILDGSNSHDPDDGISSYQWRQTGGPSVAITDSTLAQTTFKAPEVDSDEAVLLFELTVTDSGGLTDTDACEVSVTKSHQALSGSLRVTIEPADAVNAGAQWRRGDTDKWYDSGAIETDIIAGESSVEFKAVEGWTMPDNIDVTIVKEELKEVVAAYKKIITHTITYKAGAGGYIQGEASQIIAEGEVGSPVEAVPEAGYQFVKWDDGRTANPRTDQSITGDMIVTAEFITILQSIINNAIGDGKEVVEIPPGSYTVAQPLVIGQGAEGLIVKSAGSRDNTFLDAACEDFAIIIEVDDITIKGFTIKNFREAGIVVHGNRSTISANEIDGYSYCEEMGGNMGEAIRIDAADDTVVEDNVIKNADVGILVKGAAARTIISENRITGNIFAGIQNYYENNLLPTDTTAHHNHIYDNLWGVDWEADFQENWLLATDNWWGDDAGPYHEALNPEGKGDSITGNVVFYPWVGVEGQMIRRVLSGEDQKMTISEDARIIGTAANETITVEAGINVDFTAGNGDRVNLPHNLDDYEITSMGNHIWFSDAATNTTVTLIVTGSSTVAFADGETVSLDMVVAPGQPPRVQLGDAIVGTLPLAHGP